jgi:hypothetical protein
MSESGPRVGSRYSCKAQSALHRGSVRSTLPDYDGRVTLIRFSRDKNPNGPDIIDHGDDWRLEDHIEMLRKQRDRNEELPVYEYVSDGAWEYLGRYRVLSITDDAGEVARRSEVCGAAIRYVMRLEEAG